MTFLMFIESICYTGRFMSNAAGLATDTMKQVKLEVQCHACASSPLTAEPCLIKMKIIIMTNTTVTQVYPTQTIYTFEQDGIQLNLTVNIIMILQNLDLIDSILYQRMT